MVATYFLLSFQDIWWVGRDSNPQRFYVTVLQTACFTQFAYLPIFKWCRRTESNGRHRVLQTRALPAELPRHILDFPHLASRRTTHCQVLLCLSRVSAPFYKTYDSRLPTESLSHFHFLESTKVYAHGRRLSRKVALAVVILYGNIDSTF